MTGKLLNLIKCDKIRILISKYKGGLMELNEFKQLLEKTEDKLSNIW